jgi:hypothetical protein
MFFFKFKLLHRLSRFLCISIEIVVDKLVLNAVSNKNQLQSLFKVKLFMTKANKKFKILNHYKTLPFFKIMTQFSKLLAIKKSDCNLSIILNVFESNLIHIIVNRNEKILQNYLNLLSLFVYKEQSKKIDKSNKIETNVIDSNEFCEAVFKNRLFNKPLDNQSLYNALEVGFKISFFTRLTQF